jgi:hypothetical protein
MNGTAGGRMSVPQGHCAGTYANSVVTWAIKLPVPAAAGTF